MYFHIFGFICSLIKYGPSKLIDNALLHQETYKLVTVVTVRYIPVSYNRIEPYSVFIVI